ncbi:GGDEF domain-containing protein [Herbaspirillum sp. ST 5-3]|uniref:GGDEF domain-containing protein n=1 Tax=Oxalobacteraceae TaxID=75682 RepID=UPI0010A2C852|nr:GGDEF domain-containing protein [Herbaspirillum sp. ST 5-3]
MKRITDVLWHRLTGLMPGELNQPKLAWLAFSREHSPLLTRRRAMLIVNRVRLFAFLFAVVTPLWSVVDFLAFPFSLWLGLALMRVLASVAFAALLAWFHPRGNLPNAHRALAMLFFIPTVFYIGSHTLLASYHLSGFSAAISTGYAFLPFVLLSGLSIFPLTLLENLLIASPILLAQGVSVFFDPAATGWSPFAGAFWLLVLITGVSMLAGISQLAFMIALVRQANRDPLTGVFSRKSGEEMLDLQFNIASRGNSPMAVAFIDLDHFKSINDSFGHEAGDQVLIGVTEIIGANLRRGDTLARWGGEEFVVIMPNTDLAQAEAAVARLRAIGFGVRPDNLRITASIGIAERIADASADWKALVEIADQRMYRAKHGGRDRVVSTDA